MFQVPLAGQVHFVPGLEPDVADHVFAGFKNYFRLSYARFSIGDIEGVEGWWEAAA